MNPFSGTWVANLSKSRRHPKHLFESCTMQFEISGDTVTLKHSGVNMDGKLESGTTVLHADGRQHAVPEVPGLLVITSWLTTHILDTQATKDGQPSGRGTYEVSSDGQTLTATVTGIDGSGAPHVIVVDRD